MTRPPDAAGLVGQTIGGAFRLEALIGRGGFGAVYRAIDTRLDRTVAVKVALAGHDAQMARRFRREARAQADLRHRGIVRLLEFGVHGEMPYIVQEYVDGITLRALIKAQGPLTGERASTIFGQLLDALDEAHARGIVHRDIKPENIMLMQGRRGEEVRLLDFGIAKLIEPRDGTGTLTPHEAIVGSVSWLAPEQAGPGEITPRTDLYAVGCVLFWSLTGRKPFTGGARKVILSHVAQPPPPIPAHVPPTLADSIRRAMRKDPRDRFPSADAMAQAVRGLDLTADDGVGFLDPADVNTYESGISQQAPIPVARFGRVAAGVVLALVLLVVGVVLAYYYIAPPRVADGGSVAAASIVQGDFAAPAPPTDIGPPAPPPDAAAPDAQPPPPPPSPAALDRALSKCDCPKARSEHRRLVRKGLDKSGSLRARCGDTRGATLGQCGGLLLRQIEAALATCPCHDASTKALVDQLKRDFGRDLTTRWRGRCLSPGLPESCVRPGRAPASP